jgi:hypothetical protein
LATADKKYDVIRHAAALNGMDPERYVWERVAQTYREHNGTMPLLQATEAIDMIAEELGPRWAQLHAQDQAAIAAPPSPETEGETEKQKAPSKAKGSDHGSPSGRITPKDRMTPQQRKALFMARVASNR